MKRIFAIVLCLMLLVMPAAMAEEAAAQGVVVDLTGVITATMMLVFDLVLAWIAKSVMPAVKGWLDERTTESQQKRLYDVIEKLVEAAEQVIGRGFGNEKLEYVMNELRRRGYNVDTDMIEAAVKEMNDRALLLTGEMLLARDEGLPFDNVEAEEGAEDPVVSG